MTTKKQRATTTVHRTDLLKWQKEIARLIRSNQRLSAGGLETMIKNFYLEKKSALMKLAKKHATPFYVFDKEELAKSIDNFKTAFNSCLPNIRYYYAVKVNWHPWILKNVVASGFGLDVSSGRELRLALQAKAKKMVFSGPGKTEEDLMLAIRHRDKVIVHVDSFGELQKLGRLTSRHKKRVTAGVRIFTRYHGAWNKFGIPLSELKTFLEKAKQYPYLRVSGIQFHISLNASPLPYQNIIKELGLYLKNNLHSRQLRKLEFIDIGGGFLPRNTIADNPWGASIQAELIKQAAEHSSLKPKFLHTYYLTNSVSLDDYAKGISRAINTHLSFLPKLVFFTEPGRVICNNSMHVLMSVADVKAKDKIMMDGGVNIVGWEGLRYDYTPIINLTHFSPREKPANIFGCLCMADDVWAFSSYSKKISPGDLMAIPNLGAYSFSFAQNFIKGIPPVYQLL